MVAATLRKLRHGPLKPLAPLWHILGMLYQYGVSHLPGLKTSQMINCYGPFKLDAKFAFSDFSHWGHGHNEGFVQCVEDCRGKNCVIDVGAHIGLVTIPMSTVVSGQVYAFEPASVNLEYLQHHLNYNNIHNVVVNNFLIGAETQEEIAFYEMKNATGMNSRVIKKDHHLYHQTQQRQVSLDDFCKQNMLTPEVIKIDVEGAEYDVILGALDTLKKSSPIIYLSIHPKELELMGRSTEELIRLLNNLNYHAYDKHDNKIIEFSFSEYRFIKKDCL